jgi:hypothetical protein
MPALVASQLGMIGAPRRSPTMARSQYLYFSARSRWLFRLQRSVVGIARDSPSFGNKASRKADLEQRRHLKPESAVSFLTEAMSTTTYSSYSLSSLSLALDYFRSISLILGTSATMLQNLGKKE